MRHFESILAVLLALSAAGQAQITKTATFENYEPGTVFQTSFTDPLSGITFSNSSLGGFVINGDPNHLFNGDNYLTAGGGVNDSFSGFGFTADLPLPSDFVSLEVTYYDTAGGTGFTLEGFNNASALITSTSIDGPGKYTMQINSVNYDITTIKIVGVRGGVPGGEGYDNLSDNYLPEPSGIASIIGVVLLGSRRRRKKGGDV